MCLYCWMCKILVNLKSQRKKVAELRKHSSLLHRLHTLLEVVWNNRRDKENKTGRDLVSTLPVFCGLF